MRGVAGSLAQAVLESRERMRAVSERFRSYPDQLSACNLFPNKWELEFRESGRKAALSDHFGRRIRSRARMYVDSFCAFSRSAHLLEGISADAPRNRAMRKPDRRETGRWVELQGIPRAVSLPSPSSTGYLRANAPRNWEK